VAEAGLRAIFGREKRAKNAGESCPSAPNPLAPPGAHRRVPGKRKKLAEP
jgi:hypothetical protein